MPLELNDEPLRGPVPREEMARVRREVAEGRFGPGQDAAVEKNGSARSSSLMAGALVAGVFGLTTLVIAFADPELFSMSLGLTVVVTVLTVVGVYIGAILVRTRRWRRHTRMVLFAEANGMTMRLVATPEEVPEPLRKPKGPPPSHVDVASRPDSDPQVLVGTRIRTTKETSSGEHGTTTLHVPHHLTWAALHSLQGTTRQQRAAVRQRLQLPADVQLTVTSDWIVLGVERRKKDTLERLPELLVHLERAADQLIAHHPSDDGQA